MARLLMDCKLTTLFFDRLLSAAQCTSCRRAASFPVPNRRLVRPRSSTSAPRANVRHAGSYSRLKDQSERRARGQIVSADDNVQLPWKPRKDLMPEEKQQAYEQYPLVTANDIRDKSRRPRRMKMLMRDFIEGTHAGMMRMQRAKFIANLSDSLYNPSYGYFSKQAVIFNPGNPFPFASLSSENEFQTLLDDRYREFEDELDAQEGQANETRQLWHTPTELFRPHYAEAMARYLVANYKLSLYPFQDLIIYELGAGNGTFMHNVLDYIRDVEPDVYARTRYKIVEISAQLAGIQQNRLIIDAENQGHAGKVEIINQSIFHWQRVEPAPCFVVCNEVIDNFGHDAVRYDLKSEEAAQSTVLVDTDGEFYEFWDRRLDPLVARYLRVRDAAVSGPYRHPLRSGRFLRNLQSRMVGGGGAHGWSQLEYIPTRLLQFFDVLRHSFPAHRLLLSDFHSLPDAVAGINAPVVQTRFQRRTIAVSTPLVSLGGIIPKLGWGCVLNSLRRRSAKATLTSSFPRILRSWRPCIAP